MYLRLTGFDSLHLGTITHQRQAEPRGGLLFPQLCPLLSLPVSLWDVDSNWGGGAGGGHKCPCYSQLHPGVLEKAGLGTGSLNACNSRSSGLRTESISPLWETWVECHGGGRPFGMPRAHQPAAVGGGEAGVGGGHAFIPQTFFVRTGGGGVHL